MSKQHIYWLRLNPLIGADIMKNGKNGGADSTLREERLQIMLDGDELHAVDTFALSTGCPAEPRQSASYFASVFRW